MARGGGRPRQAPSKSRARRHRRRCPGRSSAHGFSPRRAVRASSARSRARRPGSRRVPSCPPASRRSTPACIRHGLPCEPAERRRPPTGTRTGAPTDRASASARTRPATPPRDEAMAPRHIGNHRASAIASATIRPFSSSLHRRRRTTPVTSARRRTIFVSSLMSTIMCTRSAIHTESRSCTPKAHSAMWGGSTALTTDRGKHFVQLHESACPKCGSNTTAHND
jgi:hypothetical protein